MTIREASPASDLAAAHDVAARVSAELRKVIVGQEQLLERLLLGLLCNGHLLIEGVPGLAKTLAVKTLADAIDASFRRIQFTPDLLPLETLRGPPVRKKSRRIRSLCEACPPRAAVVSFDEWGPLASAGR